MSFTFCLYHLSCILGAELFQIVRYPCLCRICSDIFSFIIDTDDLYFFSFRALSILAMFLTLNFGFIDLFSTFCFMFHCFFTFLFPYFSNVCDFLLFSSNFLKGKLRLFMLDFSHFLIYALNAKTFPLQL